jgi:hypothetical protein
LVGNDPSRLGIVAVVADDDPERQVADGEDRDPITGPIDQLADCGVQLAIQADDRSSMKDRGRVVQVTRGRHFGEPHNRRHCAARERRQHRFELLAFHVDRHIRGAWGVVR